MREVHVLGVGATSFATADRAPERPGRAAAAAALADAGIDVSEVDAIVVTRGPGDVHQMAARSGQVLSPRPASGVAALHFAYDAVAGGAHDVVLCVGQQGPDHESAIPLSDLASAASAYMRASGATQRTFALVASKNRIQGLANPRAQGASAVDADAILRSDVVAWPLHRLMIAAPSQGAAAVVLAAAERARPGGGARAPRLQAGVLVRSTDGDRGLRSTLARAAGLAYRAAQVGPEDIDCAEIHDLSAAAEVAAYEALQFAPEGQGPDLVDSGFTALGGVLPVNTSGGALALGEATRASALAQVCELAWQLRGEAGRRQVAGARTGLALSTAPGRGDAALVGLAILTCG